MLRHGRGLETKAGPDTEIWPDTEYPADRKKNSPPYIIKKKNRLGWGGYECLASKTGDYPKSYFSSVVFTVMIINILSKNNLFSKININTATH